MISKFCFVANNFSVMKFYRIMVDSYMCVHNVLTVLIFSNFVGDKIGMENPVITEFKSAFSCFVFWKIFRRTKPNGISL